MAEGWRHSGAKDTCEKNGYWLWATRYASWHREQVMSAHTILSEALVLELVSALKGLRYGSVEIVVHDSRVVQIERREKMRLTPEAGRKAVGA